MLLPTSKSVRLSTGRVTTLVVLAGIVLAIGWFLPKESFNHEPSSVRSVLLPAAPSRLDYTPPELSAEARRGGELARGVCTSCHLFPDPSLLDKVAWGMEILPSMSRWLGLSEFNYHDYPGGERIKAAGVVPAAPIINVEQWRAICSYYLEAAPAQAHPQTNPPVITDDWKQFTVVPTTFHGTASTTLVKIDELERRIFVGAADSKTLAVLNAAGKQTASIVLDSPPVSLETRTNGQYVTLMGSFRPSDELTGKVLWLAPPKEGAGQPLEILNLLPRPVQTVVADLNLDGREDLVVCGFGNVLGRFSWFEALGNHRYEEHILLNRPGAIHACVHDFNHDGLPDIMVMMAQAREGIYLFLNQGHGQFREVPIVEKPPAWGFSYFELADFNHDGFPDILATNGDNGDFINTLPSLKNYHGIRLYLNDGKNQFHEAWCFPMNGAYKAVARDFRQNGLLDIAAISFYPDYRHAPRESFVYLENQGAHPEFQFKAHSFPESLSGRWLTMDVGDVDGDGDLDIVLGAYTRGPTSVPHLLYEQWQKTSPAVLILKNNLR